MPGWSQIINHETSLYDFFIKLLKVNLHMKPVLQELIKAEKHCFTGWINIGAQDTRHFFNFRKVH